MIIAAILLAQSVIVGPVTSANQSGGVTAGVVGSVTCDTPSNCITEAPSAGWLGDPPPDYRRARREAWAQCLLDRGHYVMNDRGTMDRTPRFKRLPAKRRAELVAACTKGLWK